MFLKSIELFGFKSFADRSAIQFTDGIAALLGPNGCGKSNIVDAIKWVLGEQGTKSLRAEKMEDIIFNGTETRKALNVAEVTLTLSNEEGILPLEMSEIGIKRRLFRSGESEYLINGTPARLKDIREMFFDTGIGKTAYSIMEQGKIDQILSNKPEERRHIFEEAAGITKYKIRGAEAERKLEKTEENMKQVENILREVKRSHDTLKVQADKTNRYRELRDEIFTLELDIQLLRLKDFLEDKNTKEKQLSKKIEERDKLKANIETINESLEENLDLVNSMESKVIETQKALYGVDLEKESLERQNGLLQQQAQEIGRQVETFRNREKNLKEKTENLENQLTEKQESAKNAEKQLSETEGNITSFEENIEQAAGRIAKNDDAIKIKEKQVSENEVRLMELQDDLKDITDDIVRQLDLRLKETGYSFQEKKELEEKIKDNLKSLSIILAGKISIVKDLFALKGTPKEQIIEQLENISKALEESAETVTNVELNFKVYIEKIPAFLDEFLSPEGIITKKRRIDSEIANVRKEILSGRNTAENLKEDNRKLRKKIEEYRKNLEELRLSRERLLGQITALKDRMKVLSAEILEQRKLIIENAGEMKSSNLRLEEIAKETELYTRESQKLRDREKSLREELSKLEKGISERNNDLVLKEKKVKSSRDLLEKVQNQVERLQVSLASLDTEIRNLQENFIDRHSRDLLEFESKMYEIRTPFQKLKDELQKKKEELKNIGQVNLMAPEEFSEVKERYDFITAQLKDLTKARDDLQVITREIRAESTELFLETYDKIRKNFHSMFRRLFGGGRAELRLCDTESVLTSGIEIFAQPPGKKLENIALLSGGEKSLTAVSLLFATYMVKPSPFCVLDEIDAALDEENIGRFINILSEFGKSSQFIIITHNKKTVAAAKTLLGVTMAESGVSQIVSVRLESPVLSG